MASGGGGLDELHCTVTRSGIQGKTAPKRFYNCCTPAAKALKSKREVYGTGRTWYGMGGVLGRSVANRGSGEIELRQVAFSLAKAEAPASTFNLSCGFLAPYHTLGGMMSWVVTMLNY